MEMENRGKDRVGQVVHKRRRARLNHGWEGKSITREGQVPGDGSEKKGFP